MKLFYSAGSCSTSCHIALEESGLRYEAIPIDWDNETDPNVSLVKKLNPLGTLPVAILDNDHILSQNISIHTYIADSAPEKNLLPKPGTSERAEAMNWLSFVAADLHKGFSPLFSISGMTLESKAQEEIRNFVMKNLNGYLSYLDKNLERNDYLMGKTFTLADAYCFVVLGWSNWLKVPLTSYKNVQNYMHRVASRPAVQKVLKEEGLLD